jgi:hypothetical protein
LVRAFALALLFRVEVARAQSPKFEVPPECGSQAEFRSELARLAGADAERAEPSLLVIAREGAGDAAASEYRLTLDVGGERRELIHADCSVLFRSALVIAAASVRAPEVEEEAPPLRAPVAVAAPPSAPPLDEPSEPTEAGEDGPRHPLKLGGSVSGGAGLALGVLPEAAAVFEVRGTFLVERFGVSLSGKYLPPRFVSAEGRGADIHAFGLRGALGLRPVDLLWISAGLDADLLVGEGVSGLATTYEDSAWTLAPSLELALIPINTRHLALEIALQGRFAVQRPVFEVTGFRELYQVPPWGMLSVARGVFHFP